MAKLASKAPRERLIAQGEMAKRAAAAKPILDCFNSLVAHKYTAKMAIVPNRAFGKRVVNSFKPNIFMPGMAKNEYSGSL